MARGRQEVKAQERARLVVPLEEARTRVQAQLERGESVPNESITQQSVM